MRRSKTRSIPVVFLLAALLALPAAVAYGQSDEQILALVEKNRQDAEELAIKQSEMGWGTWVEGKTSDQASLYREYTHLYTKDAIEATRRAEALEKDPAQKKALDFFRLYQEVEYIGNQTALLYDIYMDLEASLWVNIDGKSVPYRELDGILSNEADPKKRAVYSKEEYKVYDILNKVVLDRDLATSHRLAKELGHPSYTDLAVAYKMFDLGELAGQCELFLKNTEAAYLDLFDRVSPISRSEFRRSDTLFVLAAKDQDKHFTGERMMPLLRGFLAGLGIDLDSQENLRVDDRDIDTKVPRAVCFSVRIPEDIRLSIKPIGGKDDYSSLFHEMGHGQHFANTKTPIWEFQELGSNAVTEGYAYLFEYMPENPLWIEDNLSMPAADKAKYLEHCRFAKLYMLRRYMAKFLYEVKLHSGSDVPRKDYQRLLSRGYGYQLNWEEASRYLSDVDAFLYSADYVQAFFLEAMLKKKLEQSFGKKWWKNTEAGDYLKSLWAYGNELSGRELAAMIGYPDGIDAKVLTADLGVEIQ